MKGRGFTKILQPIPALIPKLYNLATYALRSREEKLVNVTSLLLLNYRRQKKIVKSCSGWEKSFLHNPRSLQVKKYRHPKTISLAECILIFGYYDGNHLALKK